MCGIAGFSGTFAAMALDAMGRAIAHRGPDSAGVFLSPEDGVGLAHRRLAIIDLSTAANQPMRDEEHDVVIVFNGEIYNYRELRAELQGSGPALKTQSDTEVLLRWYLREGAAMMHRLNGIFAFAIWDGRTRELLVARDALGVKPLYFTEAPEGFLFASEIKALLPAMDKAGGIDPASLHRYLTYLWCPGEGTPLKSVRKLPPGEALTVVDGKIRRRWQWYRLPAFRLDGRRIDSATAVRDTADQLRSAVQRQLVADVPIGAFLSGGLDSSAIVAMARERTPNLRCFTIHAPQGEDDGNNEDLPYARLVARHLGLPLEVVEVVPGRLATDVARMVSLLDEPLADPASLNVLYMSQVARRDGIKVLLSGTGGDDLFTGYRRHLAFNNEWIWSWLPAGLRRGLGEWTARLDQRRPTFRRLAKLFAVAERSGKGRLASYFEWGGQRQLFDLYSPQFRESLGSEPVGQPMLEFLDALPSGVPGIEQLLALEQRFFLADHNLMYMDKMSMAAGVEVRVPFLDLELVEFAARLPSHLKQRGLEGKWILKKAMEPYLPRSVIYRKKASFGVPLRRWVRHELHELLTDMLAEDSLRRRGIFDPAAVTRLIQRNDRGEADAAYLLFSILCIELWCRAVIDNELSC